MDFLASKFTLQDFNEGLKTLPKSPDGVYELAFERITKQGEFKYRLAIRSLGWLVFAERSLTISELLHAVAIELENKKLSELKVVTEELLTSVCAGILVIDPGTKIVRLAHYTAARYLEKNKASLFDKDFHSSMARACLTYLLFDDFGSQQTTSPSSSRPKKKNTFHNYAANHWGDQ
ncbi:hypothetical protein F5Y19DRAFT_273969 [Xylariaceae sp. FL1651]|nr:hypothetical protein F5Y19DRAFT_273969 [Xylariaceae sp. FL1651]